MGEADDTQANQINVFGVMLRAAKAKEHGGSSIQTGGQEVSLSGDPREPRGWQGRALEAEESRCTGGGGGVRGAWRAARTLCA